MLAQYNPDNPTEPGNIEQMLSYKVGVQLGLEGAGTVSGAGTYKYGTKVTIAATTNTGYKFLHWLKDDGTEAFNTNASFTYTVGTEDVKFTAVHERMKVITVGKNNDAAGTVTGTGSYQKGQTVTLKATANKYYEFSHWVKDGSEEVYSNDATCSYTVGDEDVEFTAVYNCPTAVSVVSSDERMGTVGYEYLLPIIGGVSGVFEPIIGTGTSTQNALPFGNYYKYSTTEAIYKSSEIGCKGSIKSIAYYVNSASSFNCTVKIYMAHKSASTFSSATNYVPYNDLKLVYSKSGNIGTATGWATYTLDTPFEYNGTDNLVIVVTKSASSYTNSLTYRYTSVANSCLNRQSDSSTNYADASNGSGFSLGGNRPNVKFYIDGMVPEYGTEVQAMISASPKDKFKFRYWLKNDETTPFSTEQSFCYDLAEEAKFTGVFEWNPDLPGEPSDIEKMLKYNINVSANEEMAGIVSGAGYFEYGKSITISTSPNAGYTFVKWTKNGEDFNTKSSFSYTVAGEDVDFVAVYEEIPVPPVPDSHKLFLKPSSSGCCTFNLANGIEVQEGESFSVTATLGYDQVFKGWYDEEGTLLATTLTYSSAMGEEDITLIAMCEYSPDAPTEPNSVLMLDLSRATMGLNGNPLTLHAINTAGEEVATTGWASSNTEVATVDGNGVVTSVREGTATITAVFADGSSATCEITVMKVEKGDVNGDGKFTVADVSGAVMFALGESGASTKDLFEDAADFNDNGVVTVTDAISILRVVMNTEPEEGEDGENPDDEGGSDPAQARRRARAASAVLAVRGTELNAGESVAVPVNFVQRDGDFISFQFDLALPKGMELLGVDAGGNAKEQTISISRKDGYIRVVGYSLSNVPFGNAVGEDILYLNLAADKSLPAGEYNVAMSNVEIVRKNISTVTCAKQTMTVAVNNEATTIDNVPVAMPRQNGDIIYDLTGRRITAPGKGVYIVNGKKQLY